MQLSPLMSGFLFKIKVRIIMKKAVSLPLKRAMPVIDTLGKRKTNSILKSKG